MNKTNQKIITLTFVASAALLGYTVSILLRLLGATFGVVARAADYDIVRHGFPVLCGIALFVAFQFNRNIVIWADEVIAELRKVVWRPAKEIKGMTLVVVIMVLISSGIITIFDALSGWLINYILKLG